MSVDLIIVVILALAFSILFFIAEYFEQKFIQVHASFIAGISVTYFFLIVLPEIAERLPVFPFDLELFEYLFVLIGFSFVHISEKLILQKVEVKTQRKMRKLLKKEKILESVERNMEKILTKELTHENLDEAVLREIAQTLSELNKQEEGMKMEINNYKKKIQNHITKELTNFRFITDYIYHFLVGIILVGLLRIELIGGILFFIYALFRTVVTKRSEAHLVFTDLEIYEDNKFEEEPIIKYLSYAAAPTGIIIGLLVNSLLPYNIELLFLFYSFISGVILYVIVREVIPEKEKGDPLKFLFGLVGFAVVIIIINIFTNVL